jgi:hypothetical protein
VTEVTEVHQYRREVNEILWRDDSTDVNQISLLYSREVNQILWRDEGCASSAPSRSLFGASSALLDKEKRGIFEAILTGLGPLYNVFSIECVL